MRTKMFAALVAALSLSALLLAGGASAQRAARQGNENASGASKSKRVVGVRSSDTGSGSRVSITADDSLKDYSAYRSGDRFYVVLPKAAAGARGGGSGRGYSDMQVQQRGDSVVLSYKVQPGAKPRVEQKFNRLDVVFDVPGDSGQQPAAGNAARQQQPQQQTPPAENRTPAAQPNNQTQAAPNATGANAAPERRQPTPEEAARTQAANAANANAAATGANAVTPPQGVDPAAASVVPTAEPIPSATPAVEPQLAQAQPPAPIAPITTTQPAAATQTGTSLGTFLVQNWWLAVVIALVVAGLGLMLAGRRTSAAAPVEALDEKPAAKLDEPRAARAKEASAKALKDASAAAQASTVSAAKSSTVSAAETVSTVETVKAAEPVAKAESSSADLQPLAAATALAAGAAAAKSRKQSRKEARQEARRKKKGGRAEEPDSAAASVEEETQAVEPVAVETLVHEEPVAETSPVEEAVVAETPSVEQAEAPAEVEAAVAEEAAVVESVVAGTSAAEEVAQPEPSVEEVVQDEPAEVAQHLVAPVVETAEPEPVEAAASSFDVMEIKSAEVETAEVETAEVAPVEAEAAEPFVAESPAPVTAIEPTFEPDFAPDPDSVQAETQRLLEGENYDRAVVGSRDAMARQMIAAELLSALAGRNALRRERAGAAFVEHGYFEETARDLREADAPAERSAAARSLALLGDPKATPLLVNALEDPVTDVRRAAAEALGALRDPSAVGPLEALLERERSERNRIPPRVIRTAIEFCREGFEEPAAAAVTPAAETQAVIPAIETPEPVVADSEAAPAEESAGVVEALPAEEPAPAGFHQEEENATVEVAPVAEVESSSEPVAEVAAPEVAEEPSVSITPFVEEFEPFIAPGPAAEATAESAHVSEPVHGEDTFELVGETAVEPYAEPERPFVAQTEGLSTEGTFDFVTQTPASEQATLFDSGAEEVTREIEPAAADSSKELTPATAEAAPGEWFDFDISEMGGTQPAASETAEPAESVFEASSGEALGATAAAEVEEPAAEVEAPAPFVESHTEATRDIEVAEAAATFEPALREPERFVQEPAAAAREKGLAPFDERSTVPASIQQRLASHDAGERAAAIVELSHVDTDEAFQQICAAFDDEAREVRNAAARALYELRADRAESFTRALREASPERRREIGSALAASGLAGESISQLTGESRERTYEAFSLLFLMAKAGEVQPLLRAIEGHPSNEVRLAVVKLLALSGQKEVLPAFRRLAVRGSLPTEVRSAVMEAIYQISSSQPTHA